MFPNYLREKSHMHESLFGADGAQNCSLFKTTLTKQKKLRRPLKRKFEFFPANNDDRIIR